MPLLLRSSLTEGIAKPESCSASIRQQTSAYRLDCKDRELQRQHTSAHVSICQHTCQRIDWIAKTESCSTSIRQHTSAYVSIRVSV